MHKDLRLKKHTCIFILALLVLLLGEIFYQVCFAAPEVTPVEVGRPSIFSDNPNPLVCIDGNTVTLEFTVSKPASGDDAEVTGQIQIAGEQLDLTKKEDVDHYTYSATKTITGLNDGEEITCDVSRVKINQVGFEEQLLENPLDKIRFYQDLTVSDVKFISTHGDSRLIDGNQAVFSFLTNHRVTFDGDIKIGEQSVTMAQQQTSKGYLYSGSVTMSSQFNDNTVLKVDTANARIKDDYGNLAQNIIAPANTLTYFAPLIADQTVSGFRLDTTNTGRTDDGIRLVKQGDVVTVQFETTHAVTITKALIGGQEVEVSAKDGKHWSGVYTVVDSLPDNTNITMEIILDDGLNPTFVITENHFEPVRYYADIEINHLLFESNNSQSLALAKNDDDINLTFTTNHPTVISKATIAGKPVACTSQDGVHFTATYAIDGHESDQAALSYEIVVSDKAGNDSITRESDQFITYYAPIQVTDLSMISTNARDGSRYCKDGDNIVIFFKTNHTSDVAATINEKTPIIDNGLSGFTLISHIANGDIKDQGMVSFDFFVSDVAGNQTRRYTQGDVQNQIVYFAPITATTRVTGSGGKTPGYIKNGSTISAVTTANHEAQYTSFAFQDRVISTSGLSVSYTIPYDESILSEGPISYALALEDKAGNILVQNGSESIIYDRTNPAIKIEPNVAGFVNSNLDMTVTYEDANLDAGDMLLAVNGANRLADGRSAGTSYSQKLTLTGEEEYALAATATDKAGNTAAGNTAKVIIDKTNPEIVAIDVDINQVPVYKAGFKLSDHFNRGKISAKRQLYLGTTVSPWPR
ncbi:MAG: Ig-like domain repeat protein [Eubacterium sp.]